VTDLNITTNDPEQNQKVQTLRIKFPIPKAITPNVSFESSQLLCLSYFIRVQAFAQEGIYTTSEGAKSQFMVLEVPLVICTKSTPHGSTNLSPVSSPTLSFTRLPASNNSGIFRSLSNGSNDSKMTAFSALRLYNQQTDDQVSPVVVMTPRSEDSKTISSFHMYDNNKSHDTSLLGIATSLSRHSSSGSHEDRTMPVTVTDNAIDGHINDIIHGFSNKTSIEPPKENKADLEAPVKGGGKVFQMFDDSDSDEEEQVQVSRREPEKLKDNRVKPHQMVVPEFQKPHVKEEFVHKPNTVDSDSFDDETEEEEEESDLLGVLARHEKRNSFNIA
jgi:hypothetical protein